MVLRLPCQFDANIFCKNTQIKVRIFTRQKQNRERMNLGDVFTLHFSAKVRIEDLVAFAIVGRLTKLQSRCLLKWWIKGGETAKRQRSEERKVSHSLLAREGVQIRVLMGFSAHGSGRVIGYLRFILLIIIYLFNYFLY